MDAHLTVEQAVQIHNVGTILGIVLQQAGLSPRALSGIMVGYLDPDREAGERLLGRVVDVCKEETKEKLEELRAGHSEEVEWPEEFPVDNVH